MLVGYKMKLLRIQNGLTQKDIADATDIGIRQIKQYENTNTGINEEQYKKWINAIYTAKHATPKKAGRKKRVEEVAAE